VPLPTDIIFVLDALMHIVKHSPTLSMAFNISTRFSSFMENNTMSFAYNSKKISCNVRSQFALRSNNMLPSPW
jgi:hypothetical protein